MNACAFVYILTTKNNFVLYTGVTTDCRSRLNEHTRKLNRRSFTSRYNVDKLIYYEGYSDILSAIRREKYIKGKSRAWKEALINKVNPGWKDLSAELE